MKFAQHLSAHITPEWRKQYINYEVLSIFVLVQSFDYIQVSSFRILGPSLKLKSLFR